MTADKRRIDACLKACEGISTQNLEDNVPFLELARRYNALLRDNTALRARIEAMERQEPASWIGLGPRDGRIEFSTHRPAPSVMRDFNVKPLYLATGAKGEGK